MSGLGSQAGMLSPLSIRVSYDPADFIGPTQGIGGWSFGYLTTENSPATFVTTSMVWVSVASSWYGPSTYDLPFSGASSMHPMYDSPNSPAARKFVVPVTGVAEISGESYMEIPGSADGVIVRLWHNTSLIYTRTVAYDSFVGVSYDVALYVDAGDSLIWECSDGAGTSGGTDNAYFSGVVTITQEAGELQAVANGPFGALRNDYSGVVGFRFNVSSSVTVTGLSRMRSSGNSGSHSVNLWNDAGSLLATASVDCSSGTVDTFITTTITPLILTPGDYRIATDETASGDSWRDSEPYTMEAEFTLLSACYNGGAGVFPTVIEEPLALFGPVGFKFVP